MHKINWTQWIERAPLPLPRAHCAVAVSSGKLLVAGGTYWRGDEKVWSDRVDEFDPVFNRWNRMHPLPLPHAEGAFVVLGQTLTIVGGSTSGALSNSAWSFSDGAWQSAPALIPPLPRRCAATVTVGDTAYILGGCESPKDMGSAQRTVWAREAGGKEWQKRASMPGVARFWSATAVVEDKIFMAGGATMDSGRLENLDEIIAYDPQLDLWSSVGRLPFACRGASGLGISGTLMILGGYSGRFERTIFDFNPGNGRIILVGLLPRQLAFSSFACLGDRIYGVGGENGSDIRVPWTPIEIAL